MAHWEFIKVWTVAYLAGTTKRLFNGPLSTFSDKNSAGRRLHWHVTWSDWWGGQWVTSAMLRNYLSRIVRENCRVTTRPLWKTWLTANFQKKSDDGQDQMADKYQHCWVCSRSLFAINHHVSIFKLKVKCFGQGIFFFLWLIMRGRSFHTCSYQTPL